MLGKNFHLYLIKDNREVNCMDAIIIVIIISVVVFAIRPS